MTLKVLKTCIFCVKMSRFSLILRNVIMDVITFPKIYKTTSGLSISLRGIISPPDVMLCDNSSKLLYLAASVRYFCLKQAQG